MEIISLLETSADEEESHDNRHFKFFYYDKFYLVDNLKINVLLKISKIQIKKIGLKKNSVDYKILQKEFIKALHDKNTLNKYSVSSPELLDLVSLFNSRVEMLK